MKVVSLFSGAGGMDLGFKNAGFDIIWANDFFKEAVETYKKNIGDHIVLGDITKISSGDIPDGADVIIGGFPCQGFSIANIKRSMEDKRNFLYKEMLRIIKDKLPKYFVAENVKGLISMENGGVIKMIIKDFENLGYKVDYKILNAAEYGIPQMRERVLIIGNREGKSNPFPKITHYIDNKVKGLKPAPTTEQTIGFLADVRLSNNPIELKGGTMIYNHIASTNVADKFWGRKYEVNQHDICDYLKYWRDKSNWTTSKVDKHFGYAYTAGHWFRKDNNSGSIPKPEDWWELKKILGFDDKYDKQVTTLIEKEIKFEQSLRITNWNRPSDTITATSPEIHVNKMRRLSVRECAMLQTFPMDFVFIGSLNRMYTQVGNAVPVRLAELIAEEIKKELEKHN
ncbi:MAG: DNA cytosine methyltransferase [Bacteroidota bacterium]|nr:DNA cytosine methyltransferase [Bacteroidota bacterium]